MNHNDIAPVLRTINTGRIEPGETTPEEWDALIHKTIDQAAANRGLTGAEKGEAAAHLAGRLAAYRQTLEEAEAAVRRWREADIAAHGAARYGDTWVTVGPETTREIADPTTFVHWLAQAAYELGVYVEQVIGATFNLNGRSLRVTALREFAERVYRERHPEAPAEEAEAYARTIEETFVTTRRAETRLKEMPIDKAPKYAQAMSPGQRTGWPAAPAAEEGAA